MFIKSLSVATLGFIASTCAHAASVVDYCQADDTKGGVVCVKLTNQSTFPIYLQQDSQQYEISGQDAPIYVELRKGRLSDIKQLLDFKIITPDGNALDFNTLVQVNRCFKFGLPQFIALNNAEALNSIISIEPVFNRNLECASPRTDFLYSGINVAFKARR